MIQAQARSCLPALVGERESAERSLNLTGFGGAAVIRGHGTARPPPWRFVLSAAQPGEAGRGRDNTCLGSSIKPLCGLTVLLELEGGIELVLGR